MYVIFLLCIDVHTFQFSSNHVSFYESTTISNISLFFQLPDLLFTWTSDIDDSLTIQRNPKFTKLLINLKFKNLLNNYVTTDRLSMISKDIRKEPTLNTISDSNDELRAA